MAADSATPVGTFTSSFEPHEAWVWSFNSTSDIESLEFVDKEGTASAPTYFPVVELAAELNTTDADGMLMLTGSFADSDVNTDLFEGMDGVAEHVCEGHIFLRANTTGGESLLAPLEYQVNSEGETCEDAVAHGDGHDGSAKSSGRAVLAAAKGGMVMLITAGAVALAL